MSDDHGWTILAKHGPAAHALLLRLTLRADVADDLLHDLFVRLHRRVGRADNPAGYVHRTAVNLAMDWRSRRRSTEDVSTADPPAADRDPVLAAGVSDDVTRILDVAAVTLTELERQAFALRFVQQMSFEDVGVLIGRTPHQARGLCHAAVRRIRAELGLTGAKP
jgi:RNA polymerase sigma-70 factor (ECF subfamily)